MGIELLTDSTTAWEWYIPHNTLYILTIRQRSIKLIFGKSSINLSPHYFPSNPKFTTHPLHLSPSLSLKGRLSAKDSRCNHPHPTHPSVGSFMLHDQESDKNKNKTACPERLQHAYTSSLVIRHQGSEKVHWTLTLYLASSQSRQSL